MGRRTLVAIILLFSAPGIAAPLPERRSPIVDAVSLVSPAVVNISTTRVIERDVAPFSGLHDPLFDEFFRDFFEPRRQRHTRSSLGSGVIIREDGYILTNQHVVTRAAHITVLLADEREFDAQIVGADADSDLAVLTITADHPLPAVPMGTSADLMPGEAVIAIGNPFGLSHTVTTGVISAVGRSLQAKEQIFYDLIQTDASINPGNSGGPLLNIAGQLIGINSAIYEKAKGIGFAIPIDRAHRIVSDLIDFGSVQTPWSGLLLQDLPSDRRPSRGSLRRGTVRIQGVEPNSPATEAGVESGDLLLSIDNRPVHSLHECESRLRDQPIGSTFSLSLLRRAQTITRNLTTRLFPVERADELAWQILGLRVRAQHRRIEVSAIRRDGPSARQGFRPGDLIVAVAGRPVERLDDFRKLVFQVRNAQGVLLSVQRDRNLYHVPVRFQKAD